MPNVVKRRMARGPFRHLAPYGSCAVRHLAMSGTSRCSTPRRQALRAVASKKYRLPIRPEYTLQRRTDLVQRAIPPRAFEDIGHRVLAATRRRTEGVQRLIAR